MRLDEIRERGPQGISSNDWFDILEMIDVAVKLRKAVAHYEDCTGPNHDPEAAWEADGALDEAQAEFMKVMDAFEEDAG